MDKTTTGCVIAVKKQWWLKVNRKLIRMHALDGAEFPYVITVKYAVNRQEYIRKKWIRAGAAVPALGSEVTVLYSDEKSSRAKVL
jgi:hypothetical protein